MKIFKVNNITFYLGKNCILKQNQIEEVLNTIGSDRYNGLKLEIYFYEKSLFEHLKIAYKKSVMSHLLTYMFKKALGQ